NRVEAKGRIDVSSTFVFLLPPLSPSKARPGCTAPPATQGKSRHTPKPGEQWRCDRVSAAHDCCNSGTSSCQRAPLAHVRSERVGLLVELTGRETRPSEGA